MFVALGLVLSQTNWITVPVLLHFLNRYLNESKIMQATDLQSVRQVISTATGLPNAHYIDPRIYEEEKKVLLFNQWAGLAIASDIKNPGDVIPLNFLGLPLFLIKDKLGTVRVFQNTCRHRGMILVEKRGKIEGAIRCPYHSWCYSIDGHLVSTPHVGGPGHNTHQDIKRSELGLFEIRSHIWRDVIWINVNNNAAKFETSMSDAISRWSEFDQPMYHGGSDSRLELQLKCNWKLVVENFCESYHLPWVHPDLNSYSRLADHYNIEKTGVYSGQGTRVYRQLTGDNGDVFPDFPSLSPKWRSAAEYLAIYPNVLLGTHRDHAFAIILTPDGPDKTIESIHFYYPVQSTNAKLRKKNKNQWKAVFEEDIFVVEGMQRGRHGVAFDGGKFSPVMDGPTHCFHKWAASQLDEFRAEKNGFK